MKTFKEALAWVERGIDLDKKTPHGLMASHDLAKLKRDLLTKLGRGNEALDAAWADYREHPSTYTYDDLMKYVPKTERAKWREKAIEAAMDADLGDTLVCGLTPSGRIDVRPGSLEDGPRMSAVAAQRILDAFNVGRGRGVLHLGAGELGTELHPTLSYWRDIGQAFVARVCGALDPDHWHDFLADPTLADTSCKRAEGSRPRAEDSYWQAHWGANRRRP